MSMKIGEENINDLFAPKNRVIVDSQFITKSCEGDDFKNHVFTDVGCNKLTFKFVDFSFCIFDNAYFRDCKFEKCKFIGAKFIDSNFKGASFVNCKFQYSTFKNTEISCNELLSNLSPWPNANRDWLRRLRMNYESLGDVASIKACVKEEMLASRDHLRKAREAKESYYSDTYKGFLSQASIRWESFLNFIDWHLWGHGEHPYKLGVAVLIWIAALSLVVMFDSYEITPASIWSDIAKSYLLSLRDVGYTFTGIKQPSVSEGLASLLSISRYIALGLFISVLYKSIARR